MHSSLLADYYSSLLDVLVAFGFLVVFKVAGAYVMRAVYNTVRDTPADSGQSGGAPAHTRQSASSVSWSARSRGYRFLWLTLVLYWAASGLLQVRPVMVLESSAAYLASLQLLHQPHWLGSALSWAAGIWFWDPTASNIISILLQISMSLTLYLGRRYAVGRVALWVSLVLALWEWVFGEAFGGLFTGMASAFTGFPGAAAVVAMFSMALLYPAVNWQNGRAALLFSRVLAGCVAVLALWQLSPSGYLWRSDHLLRQLAGVRADAGADASWIAPAIVSGGVIGPFLNGLFALLLIVVVIQLFPWSGRAWVTVEAAAILLLFWLLGQAAALPGRFALGVGPLPLLAMAVIALHLDIHDHSRKREEVASR
ncbi:MAG: hypothetical protein ACYCYO_22615 [Bacilli bacterium]